MPRKPWRSASSGRRCVSSSFQAVPYRKRGTRTPSIAKVLSFIDFSGGQSVSSSFLFQAEPREIPERSVLVWLLFGERLLLGLGQCAHANVADGPCGLVGGDPERLAGVALDAGGDAPVLGVQIDHLVAIDPGLDPLLADP